MLVDAFEAKHATTRLYALVVIYSSIFLILFFYYQYLLVLIKHKVPFGHLPIMHHILPLDDYDLQNKIENHIKFIAIAAIIGMLLTMKLGYNYFIYILETTYLFSLLLMGLSITVMAIPFIFIINNTNKIWQFIHITSFFIIIIIVYIMIYVILLWFNNYSLVLFLIAIQDNILFSFGLFLILLCVGVCCLSYNVISDSLQFNMGSFSKAYENTKYIYKVYIVNILRLFIFLLVLLPLLISIK